MCGRLGVSGRIATPGTIMHFSIGKAKRMGIWGIKGHQGFVHNARIESLEGYWRHIKDNRGILPVNSFIEPEGPVFSLKAHGVIGIAVIYDEHNNFAVVTQNSVGIVKSIHPRMPIVITNPKDWIEQGIATGPNPEDIIISGDAGPSLYKL